MADFSGQSGPSNGPDSAPVAGGSTLSLPGGPEAPSQNLQTYAAAGLTYPPPYVAPAMAAQQEQLRQFWLGHMQEIHQVGTDPAEFKNHQLPLARIKKIMKSDEDVRMISAEAPVLFARACEMFILELTLRSWNHSEENKRRTLQRNDIAAAITRTDIFDFLVDIVPREERGDEAPAAGLARPVSGSSVPSTLPQSGSVNAISAAGIWPQPAPGNPGPDHLGGIRPQAPIDPSIMQYYMQQQQQQQQQQHISDLPHSDAQSLQATQPYMSEPLQNQQQQGDQTGR